MNFKYSEEELLSLAARDKKIAVAINLFGKIERETEPDLFSALISQIVGQQISNKAFETVWGRFLNYFGKITPEKINAASLEVIGQLGISAKKAANIKNIADKIKNGELNLEKLKKLSDEDAIEELTKLNGIGRWTAEMLLLFSMGRKNILSFGDFAIRRGMKILYNQKEITKTFFEKIFKLYSPYSSIASFYLWAIGNSNLKSFPRFVDKDDDIATYSSPIGKIILSGRGEFLTGLFFADINCKEDNSQAICDGKKYLDAYFQHKKLPPVQIKFRGTNFQQKVWNELLKIPYGQTTSYKNLAQKLNSSPRAIGQAVGKNPVSIIVPCHRVVGKNNELTGYEWGVEIKQKLLETENVNE